MKTRFLIITLFFIALGSHGQERKELAISIYGGALNSPYYKNALPGAFMGLNSTTS
jgi:hypothetical protein